MLINKDYLLKTVKEEADRFRIHFESSIPEIDKFVQKPKCSICMKNLIKSLFADIECNNKLAKIFDDPDLKYTQDILDHTYMTVEKTAKKTRSKVEAFYVDVPEYKKFIEAYCQDKMIRSIDTVFIPKKAPNMSQILVTIHWSSL